MTFQSILFSANRWGFSAKRRNSFKRMLITGLGISAGVMALIVVIGVMGGLQKGYIDSILEISSFHIRVTVPNDKAAESLAAIRSISGVASAIAVAETYVLAMSPSGQTVTLFLRGLEPETEKLDPTMTQALGLSIDDPFPRPETLILGKEVSSSLAIRTGSMLTIFGIVQDEELGSIPVEENIEVSGVFNSGYYDFDSSMGYVELPLTEKRSRFFPANTITIGIKLDDRFSDNRMIQAIRNVLPNTATGLQSWREYNKSFFGALRTEKTIMMLLISLIFLVVGINIFHAMRRAIAVKKNDIAVLKACGATNADIRSIFIVDGLSIGIFGAVSGLIMGLVITYNINEIIEFFSLGMRALGSLLESLGLITSVRDYRLFSPAYFYLDSIPVSIGTGEIIFILGIAIASTSMAALLASRRVSEASPSEVLRNE